MRRQNAHQRRRQQELDQARARLIAHLLEAIGPALSAEVAEQILEQAKAWGSLRARELDDHLADNPDALTAPSGRHGVVCQLLPAHRAGVRSLRRPSPGLGEH
ncbi:hypothetical protein ACFVWX_22970 [Streptomyces sp. NPDC058220]|uniref:hypothetical protein n=1 Tax=Streptomyces sp. NPDC058220 TaxID=3346387 RepID=UPI0036E903CB